MYYQYPFKSNYFQVDDHKLHYIDEGEGDVIIMVHGNPTWSYYYRNLIAELSKNNRVIALDNIGCGLSDKPTNYTYTLADHIINLTKLKGHLDIQNFSLVVHDWGGAIGVGMASRFPEELQKIVVLNTAAFRSKAIPFRIQICKWPIIGKIVVQGFNGFAWPATFMAVTKKLDKRIKKALLSPYNSWKNRVAVHAFVKDIPLDESHVSYKTLVEVEEGLESMQKKKVPMLILWGGKDFCFNDSFYEEWCQRFDYARRVYFKDGGHYILEDKFDDIKVLMNEFFQK